MIKKLSWKSHSSDVITLQMKRINTSLYSRTELVKATVVIIIMLTLWASAYVGIRAGLKGYSPGSLALFRYLVASFCMFFIYLRLPKFRLLQWRELLLSALAGILGFSIYNLALNTGELTVNAGIASFIASQMPVVITILAIIFLGERLSWRGWLGTLISFLGILLIALSQTKGGKLNTGVLFVLIATLSGGVYTLVQKPLLHSMHPIEFTAISIWAGTLALLFFLPSLIQEIPKAPLTATLWVVYLGIFPAAIAYLLWGYVIAKMPASRAASFLYLVPLITLILGWLFLNEIPKLLAIGGGLLALMGALLVKNGVRIEMQHNIAATMKKTSHLK